MLVHGTGVISSSHLMFSLSILSLFYTQNRFDMFFGLIRLIIIMSLDRSILLCAVAVHVTLTWNQTSFAQM